MPLSVSVIVPVYNSEKYLDECLQSLLSQSIADIEIICINDSSTDGSVQILENYARQDSRVNCFTVPHSGAGAARNRGIQKAQGEYIYFFDSDDVADKDLLKKATERARQTKADIVAFHGCTFENDDIETKTFKAGFNLKTIGSEERVFNYKDFPEKIMSIVNVVPWNKLFRAEFVKSLPFAFDEISSTNDIAFSALCTASAQRIALVNEELMYHRINHAGAISFGKTKNLGNVIFAVESTVKQAKTLSRYNEIVAAVKKFAVENYCFAFENYCLDIKDSNVKQYYEYIRSQFIDGYLSGLEADNVGAQYRQYQNIINYDYNQMVKIRTRDIIVSLTTYPARISTIHKVIDNLNSQTKKADKILLWLAEADFENGFNDLPPQLLEQQQGGMVEIRFCENLFSHKKYYYTMKEYPNSIVITVDDDLIYPKQMIEWLYHSYLRFPECISAMRAHIITVNPYEKEILPYEYWVKEYKSRRFLPSMQLFATSGAGTLYPPHLLSDRLFDKDVFMEICQSADDVWLNAMGLINGVPTVLAKAPRYLQYIEGTQQDTLYSVNVGQGKNTAQFNNVRMWLAQKLGYDAVYENLTADGSKIGFITYEQLLDYINSVSNYYDGKVKKLKARSKERRSDLKRLEKRTARLGAKNEKYKEKNRELKSKNTALKEKNKSLKKRNADLKEKIKSLKSRNTDLKEQNGVLKKELERQKSKKRFRSRVANSFIGKILKKLRKKRK